MPIYEYECQKCGHQTEILQKFSDPPVARCTACHGKMKKFIMMFMVVVLASGVGFAKKKKVTEVEKLIAQKQVLVQKKNQLRKQYQNDIALVEIELIKIEAVLTYLSEKQEK